MSQEIAYISAHELVAAFAAGSLTPPLACEVALKRQACFEPVLNAFQVVDAESARESAERSAGRWRQGRPLGPLDGVPLHIKDTVQAAGWPTRLGSLTVAAEGPWQDDAPVVARLREAGAVILGKTTMPEFGWKGMTDGPLFGTTRNPWKPARTPGGSSGGAAAALAAGIGQLAFGNDGGGSIRIPANFCGLFGLKPNFGRVPNWPNENPFATLVAGGPITRNVRDAALMLNEMAKPDRRDWYALPYRGQDWTAGLEDGVEGLKVAFAPGLGGAEPDAEILAPVRRACDAMAALGATVEEVGEVIAPLEPDFADYWIAAFASILRQVPRKRWDDLDPEFHRLAEAGLEVGMEAYVQAMEARARLGTLMNAFHADYDLLLTPTQPTPPPSAGTIYHSAAYDRYRHAVPYTLPFNLTGQPAASLPCGVTTAGLPVGLQIVGPQYGEALVLRAAASLERELALPVPHPKLVESLAEIVAEQPTGQG
ncbi:MAG: amidase [Alphaproteobacteria bacterium]|nr:amidase [Alphaproteobacteria bacterium]